MGRWVKAYLAAHLTAGPGMNDILGALFLLIGFVGADSPSRLIWIAAGVVTLVFAHALIFRQLWITKEKLAKVLEDIKQGAVESLRYFDPRVDEWTYEGKRRQSVRLWLTNTTMTGAYATRCSLPVTAIERLDGRLVEPFSHGSLAVTEWNTLDYSLAIGPGEWRQVTLGRWAEELPQTFRINWGITVNERGAPLELPFGRYRIGLYAQGANSIHGSIWLELHVSERGVEVGKTRSPEDTPVRSA